MNRFLIAAALLWSFGGLLIKLVDLDGLALAGARSGCAAILIGLYMLRPAERPPAGRSRFALDRTILLGALAYAGTVVAFVVATRTTTAANAILLQYTAPLWVALLSPLLLRERTAPRDWALVTVAFCGVILFFIDDVSTTARLGDLLGLASGLFFGLCIMALRFARRSGALAMVFWGNIIALLVGLPQLLSSTMPLADLPWLLLLGFGQLGLGYVAFTIGIREVSALQATLVSLIEPVLNPLWVGFAIGEIPSLYSIAGGTVILAVLVLRELLHRRERRDRPDSTAPT